MPTLSLGVRGARWRGCEERGCRRNISSAAHGLMGLNEASRKKEEGGKGAKKLVTTL